MRRPEMILFDYGGTLLLEPEVNFLSAERALFPHVTRNPLGVTPEELARVGEEQFASLSPARRADLELSQRQLLRFRYEYNRLELDISWEEAEEEHFAALIPMTEAALTPHVRGMLAFLKREGVRTAVVSNLCWSERALRRRLNTLLPENEFEFVIVSSEYGLRKPDKRLFELALRKARLPAERVWFFGDRFAVDIVGAADAGVYPVLFGAEGEDAPFAYGRLDDWAGLPDLLAECE